MSDSVTKWYEIQEEKTYIYESPDGGKTVTRRPFGGDVATREVTRKSIVSEGTKQQAYNILVEYPKEAILEAARILKVGE
jgi:hypothetical protein